MSEPNVADRCDRCLAKAFVHVVFASGELHFCAHHYTEYEEPIKQQALTIDDERPKVLLGG